MENLHLPPRAIYFHSHPLLGAPDALCSTTCTLRRTSNRSGATTARVACADYRQMPNVEATWYIDPPYDNRAGSYYVHADVDCGQVIVCENEGATWLPFRPFATLKAGVNGRGSREVIFVQ